MVIPSDRSTYRWWDSSRSIDRFYDMGAVVMFLVFVVSFFVTSVLIEVLR